MMEKVRRIPKALSLKPEDVHGYRNIVGLILEKYDDLGELTDDSLESHEREALQMFKEFEKHSGRSSERRIPVFG